MGKLRKLQERYLKGELTKAQYEAECKKLLDDEILDQDAYDDALDYDPDYERPKYSQADVDSTVAKKAVKMVRKALKDAGVTVEADDKTLLSKVAETIKNGSSGKGDGEGGSGSSIDETELSNLKTKAAKVDDLTAQCKKLLIENAVLKEAGKYNPVNPAQVVRAISADYLDSIEFDEENGTEEKYKSFMADYEKDGDKVMLSADTYADSHKDQGNSEVSDYNGIAIAYISYVNKVVPADYQQTEQDMKDEESGKYVFSYGAEKVVIHGGYNPRIYFPCWYTEQSALFWKDFLREDPCVDIVLENVLEEEPEYLLDIVRAADHPRLGLCLDVGHANAYSAVPAMEWLKRLAPYLRHFHLHNNDGSFDAHAPLNEGDIPMKELLQKALALCPAATFALEVPENTARGARWLAENGFITGETKAWQ